MRSAVQIVQDAYSADGSGVELLPFFYSGRIAVNAESAIQTSTEMISIDRDSDFVWFDTRIIAHVFVEGFDVPVFNYRAFLTFQLNGTGRHIEQGVNALNANAPIGGSILSIAGQADRPFVFYEPVLVPARTAIVVTLLIPPATFGKTLDVLFTLGGMKAISVSK
jgi:hypothetical protein